MPWSRENPTLRRQHPTTYTSKIVIFYNTTKPQSQIWLYFIDIIREFCYLCPTMKIYFLTLVASLLTLSSCGGWGNSNKENTDQADQEIAEVPKNIKFGIVADGYNLESHEIKMGQTMGALLSPYGITAAMIDRLDKAAKTEYPLKNIRGGNPYTLFLKDDSLATRKLDYFVYEQNKIDYVVFGFVGDSITITKGQKPTKRVRLKKSATINSSLWGAIMDADLPYALAAELENIYQWSVDFFSIQKGDNFTVVYDELFVDDTLSVGIGRVWGARFYQGNKDHYAIPFKQNTKVEYWEEDGGSLRKMMLKAPLKYSRISSKFTRARFHPIYKVYRPHTGVDYAAPTGTPVHSVADGVVTFKGWGGGGGNTLKIKHAGGMMTGYLHLSRYAKGIATGTRVSQGQTIGYVGSTGASTGPHLDYRIWKNGTPIDPLKIPQEPTEPISEANKEAFEFIKSRIMAELNGEVDPKDIITNVDSLMMPKPTAEPAPEQ